MMQSAQREPFLYKHIMADPEYSRNILSEASSSVPCTSHAFLSYEYPKP